MIKHGEDGSISYEGFCIDLLKQLAKMLHFTYEIYLSPDGQYGGITENNTWDGMMGELVNKVSTLSLWQTLSNLLRILIGTRLNLLLLLLVEVNTFFLVFRQSLENRFIFSSCLIDVIFFSAQISPSQV